MPTTTAKREVGGTENSWCRAVPGGTGITVLGLLLRKPPNVETLETGIHTLQKRHPILRSRLHLDRASQSFSFVIPDSPSLRIQILHSRSNSNFQEIVEQEINDNPWEHVQDQEEEASDVDVFQAKVQELEGSRWVVVLKAHTAACDRAAAVAVLRELLAVLRMGGGAEEEESEGKELKRGIEEYIPEGKGSKPLWVRGINMLGYSFNSFRLSNIPFVDPVSPRRSQLIRLRLDSDQTANLVQGCKRRDLKLCGALAAAGLMAARLCKHLPQGPGHWEKYSVVTLTDCRLLLHPPLTPHAAGFYHSAVLNTHDLNGTEHLWDLAKRTYNSFLDAKNANKHFSDMADLNFLMCKAIDNPGLTPSSSLRTSFISVFEDAVIDQTDDAFEEMGVEDYLGCASVHGIGPTLALFDTIRDGRLDCACMYPAPLHSADQMQELIHHMKRILVDAFNP